MKMVNSEIQWRVCHLGDKNSASQNIEIKKKYCLNILYKKKKKKKDRDGRKLLSFKAC